METQTELKIHDRPIALWIVGLVFLSAGIFILVETAGGQLLFSLIFGGVGLALLLLSNSLTITADRRGRMLKLDYRSLVNHSAKQIPFDNIARIELQRSASYSRGGTSYTYRVAAVLKDGSMVPFRSSYSSGVGGKQKLANQINAFLGLQQVDYSLGGLIRQASQQAQAVFQQQQEAQTGDESQERIANGVHWKVQTRAFGAQAVTRWHSSDFRTSGTFLNLAQKVRGQSNSMGRILGALEKPLFQQSLAIYGYGPDDTPDLEFANVLTQIDPRIGADFVAFSNDPIGSSQILNAWVAVALTNWAERHPLKQFMSGGIGQVSVLFSPNGVYVGVLGTLQANELDELAALGADLVRAQSIQS